MIIKQSDPITTEVIARYIISIAEEMGVVLMRTAFSPNIKERNDCSTAIFDENGEVVAQAEHIAIHLGSMIGAIDAIKQLMDINSIRPGDMYLANDPYNGGGSHLPDLNLIAPVFFEGHIVAFVANIAHHADIGGMVPGSEAAVCETIFQEGLRIPPVRLVQNGELNSDLVSLIVANSRTPEERLGDLNAQFAANLMGIKSLTALIGRYGLPTFKSLLSSYLDYSERRMRTAISKLPNGEYHAEDFLSGGDKSGLAKICCRLEIFNDCLLFDFDGTANQLNQARNIPNQALLATIYTVVKALLDPEAPANGGAFRVVKIFAPKGCIVQPRMPAPVGARSLSCGILSDVILAALSQATPGKGMASCGPHALLLLSGDDPRNGKYFVNYETVAGGLGALENRHGLDGVRTLTSGSANLPIEALEHAFPFRVENYSIRKGSGGDGNFCGGNGLMRDYRILGENVTVSLTGERQQNPAKGVDGGKAGATGEFFIDPETNQNRKLSSAEKEIPLPKGTMLRVVTPGGGGWGDN